MNFRNYEEHFIFKILIIRVISISILLCTQFDVIIFYYIIDYWCTQYCTIICKWNRQGHVYHTSISHGICIVLYRQVELLCV